jgi:hypothetical protein
MEEWSKYYFTDIPFKEAAFLQPEINDARLNGTVFSMSGMEKAYKDLLDLIRLQRSICYVRSDDLSRGTGKSALMAKVYWDIKQSQRESERFFPIWVSVHDFRTINQLMGRVVDTMVFAGLMDIIKRALGVVNYNTVDSFLGKKKSQRIPSEVGALTSILALPNESLAWKYINIRRTYPDVGNVELFSDLMIMFSLVDSRRVLIFIDQFEEYAEYQRGMKLVQLGQDIKDLYRCMASCGNLSFVVTMHPNTQREFENRAGEIIKTYGEIMDNAATVEKLEPEHLVKIAKEYILHYRTDKFPKDLDDVYPFNDSVLLYVAEHSNNNPRTMIRILGHLLREAMLSNAKRITPDFVRTPKIHARVGLGAMAKSDA